MNKKLISSLATLGLMSTMMINVVAEGEWHPSRVQDGATLGSGSTITMSDGSTREVTVGSSDITVTNVTLTLDSVAQFNDGTNISFADKATQVLGNGLSYAASQETNLVYQAVLSVDSPSGLLDKFTGNSEVADAIAQQIAANKSATLERLNAQLTELESAGDTEGAAAIEAKIASLEVADYESFDNYSPAAMFDVSVSDEVAEIVANGGSVDVTINVDGVTEESDVLALHFVGDLSDADAAVDQIMSDPTATVDEMGIEVLPCVSGDGEVTLTMDSFSPVMILSRVEAPEEVTGNVGNTGVEAEQSPVASAATDGAETDATSDTTNTEKSDNAVTYVVIGGVVIAVGAGGAYVVSRNKKKAKTANKQ